MDGNVLISTKIFPKVTFDHHPISLLLEEEENIGPIPFRLSPLSIEMDGFWETVTQFWPQFVEGSPRFFWEQKLKHTKYAMKNSIKPPLPNPARSREVFVQALAELQLSMENSEISKSQLVAEQAAQVNSFLSFRQEEEHLWLKSRSLWLLAGDKNFAYFHQQCRSRLSRNHISEICASEDEVIKGQV